LPYNKDLATKDIMSNNKKSLLSLGGHVIDSHMSTGQLQLIARCIKVALTDDEFADSLTFLEEDEARSLAKMFEDPELETAPDGVLFGFCR